MRAESRPVATKELHDEIAAADRMVFDAVFNTCDTQALAGLVTDDSEMFHDKGGLVATSGAQFVENIKGMCERQKTGEDYRARRELVEGSLKVYPLNNYGTVEVGVHRFKKRPKAAGLAGGGRQVHPGLEEGSQRLESGDGSRPADDRRPQEEARIGERDPVTPPS